MRIHLLSPQGMAALSPYRPSQVFGLAVTEAVNCSKCGDTTHQSQYTQYFYNTQVRRLVQGTEVELFHHTFAGLPLLQARVAGRARAWRLAIWLAGWCSGCTPPCSSRRAGRYLAAACCTCSRRLAASRQACSA